ncbi:unnamed protein product [Porites evermanni]|uniref:F5/8 type C domain-containing protein n=1 Tax=Porites evermanni TaxID=104178 RepID=A0ABN8SRG2_9CNID|nr:unnamed protein product [Porites evermanni]
MFCSCRLISFLTGGRCREALGMENGKIADDQITASSEGEAYRAVNGRLHYITPQGRPFGWQPKSTSCISEWLQVDLLLDNYTITGVATQGCRARTSKSVLSVTKYELEYSNDSKMFYTDHRLYTGNTDEDTVVYQTLNTPMKARYVRFQPKFWKNGICMRVELYGKITTGTSVM